VKGPMQVPFTPSVSPAPAPAIAVRKAAGLPDDAAPLSFPDTGNLSARAGNMRVTPPGRNGAEDGPAASPEQPGTMTDTAHSRPAPTCANPYRSGQGVVACGSCPAASPPAASTSEATV
jgi:hypothetical protein